jgi:hypothetical protein
VLLGVGNSGEAVVLGCHALAYADGSWLPIGGLNNDRLPPRPLRVRRPDGSAGVLDLSERLVLDGDNPREQIADDPLLAARYARLLRGIPVFETYPRAGAGGHGHPVVSALDMDLHIDAVLGSLRRLLRHLRAAPPSLPGQSAIQRLMGQGGRPQEPARAKRVVLVGGGCGAMGNAGHQLLPYLVRRQLAEQGMPGTELWGVVLGPRAFTGLTPFVRQNYRALLEAIEHQSRHGQRRAYRNDLELAIPQPPYDRVFLLDDPTLPGAGTRVSAAELDVFLDRAALTLHVLLRGSVWPTVASHTANDDGVTRADGHLGYLHTAAVALVAADRAHLTEVLAADLVVRALDRFRAQVAP